MFSISKILVAVQMCLMFFVVCCCKVTKRLASLELKRLEHLLEVLINPQRLMDYPRLTATYCSLQ